MDSPLTRPAASLSALDSDDDVDLFGDESDADGAAAHRLLLQQRAECARRDKLASLPPVSQRTPAQNRTAYVLAGRRLQPTRLDGVLDTAECELVLAAVVDYVDRLGGLQTERHEKFATTDVPVSELNLPMPVSTVPGTIGKATVGEAVLSWVTRRIIEPMAMTTGFRPSDLGLKDLFVVCYCGKEPQIARHGAATYPIPSKQASLAIHSDGCLLSFSLLLNHHDAFEAGGTYFKATDETFHVEQGGLLMHDAGLERECDLPPALLYY